ncbi:hypothetical protein SAMN05421819_0861 [Bryocella elongata]|uniref:Uncharacterized protein n=1 Tax=Bryocella elongata TaxID=863522 RepID=A0A1H5U428_9BACT|nr:hypothetical protein [Bryocella elongata]SEF69834.1 hypothetical protein SAMN05421819_0861 [Bryocella elongata]
MNSEHKVTEKRRTASWLAGAILMLLGVSLGGGQSTHPSPLDGGAVGPPPTPNMQDETDPLVKTREATQARTYATDRQRKLLADADKLVELSNDLKTEVNKSTKNDLSLTVIKKASEIEKLAHEMKDRERY